MKGEQSQISSTLRRMRVDKTSRCALPNMAIYEPSLDIPSVKSLERKRINKEALNAHTTPWRLSGVV